MSLLLLPDLLCLLICAIAVVTDLKERRIPNWLTGSGVALGLLVNPLVFAVEQGGAAGAKAGLLSAALGGGALLLSFGLFGLIKFVGMGDVKLMVAVGALLRWPTALWALAYVVLAGGVIAVIYVVARGRVGQVLRNMGTIAGRALRLQQARERALELHRIPYALAILIGASWAAAIKYFPQLQL